MNKNKIKKILVISLTNIGDVILTFPVIDVLMRDYPHAKISVVVGPKAETLFNQHPLLDEIIIYNKKQSLKKMLQWLWRLRRRKFDMVVDLRNSSIPMFLFPCHQTSYFVPKCETYHMKEKHLKHLQSVHKYQNPSDSQNVLMTSSEDEMYMQKILFDEVKNNTYIVVAPGAADKHKKWSEEKFATVCRVLQEEHKCWIVFVGDGKDKIVSDGITKQLDEGMVLNMCGITTLLQLSLIMKKCLFALVNDSSPMHMASYVDKPVLAIFGPSNPKKYGPWSSYCRYFKKAEQEECLACQNGKLVKQHTCLSYISAQDVLQSFTIEQGRVIFSDATSL